MTNNEKYTLYAVGILGIIYFMEKNKTQAPVSTASNQADATKTQQVPIGTAVEQIMDHTYQPPVETLPDPVISNSTPVNVPGIDTPPIATNYVPPVVAPKEITTEDFYNRPNPYVPTDLSGLNDYQIRQVKEGGAISAYKLSVYELSIQKFFNTRPGTDYLPVVDYAMGVLYGYVSQTDVINNNVMTPLYDSNKKLIAHVNISDGYLKSSGDNSLSWYEVFAPDVKKI